MKTTETTTQQPPPENRLGELEGRIVGMQYYDAVLTPGTRVYLEREYDNPHDDNAVRVDTEDCRPAGHIPRWLARWLGPLIDAGEVIVDGHVPPERQGNRCECRIELEVFLTAKGRRILQPAAEPVSSGDVIHGFMLQVWQQLEQWDELQLMDEVLEKLEQLLDNTSLPESHLLWRLMREKARQRAVAGAGDAGQGRAAEDGVVTLL